MNKLVFALLLGLFFTACKDTPKTATDAPVTATEVPVVPAPEIASTEVLQQVSTTLTSGLKTFEDLRTQVDKLPAKAKKEKAAEIAGIYSTLEGLMVKQGEMLKRINAANAPPSEQTDANPGLNVDEVKDYIESAARYSQQVPLMQEAINNMTAPAKKQ